MMAHKFLYEVTVFFYMCFHPDLLPFKVVFVVNQNTASLTGLIDVRLLKFHVSLTSFCYMMSVYFVALNNEIARQCSVVGSPLPAAFFWFCFV